MTAVPGARGRGVVAAVGLAYLLGLGVLLIAPLKIVRYHTMFWQFTGRFLGLGWTAGREQALDAAVNGALFLPLGFLGHRWWRAGSTPSWATASATVTIIWCLAASVEVVQIFLPWRSASVTDVFSDAIGAMAGAGLDALLAWVALRSRDSGGGDPGLPVADSSHLTCAKTSGSGTAKQLRGRQEE